MSYGLTPYDKKSYRESKRRRRQAFIADKTGKILPYSTAKRRIIVALLSTIILIGTVAGCYFLFSNMQNESHQSISLQEEQSNEELLRIVNRQNPLEKDYVPELTDYDSFIVNRLVYENLERLTDESKQQGIELKITSAYISYEEQESLYNDKLDEFLANPDYTEVRAQAATQKLVPQAGCSEAQTGLLIGFDTSDKRVASFVERKCVDYGFILRYPEDKEDITRMTPNDSLYRYVGIENAMKLRSYDMSLEEYVEYLEIQKNSQ